MLSVWATSQERPVTADSADGVRSLGRSMGFLGGNREICLMISKKVSIFGFFRPGRGMRSEPRDEICLMISKNPEYRASRVGRHGKTWAPKFAGAERAAREEAQSQGRVSLSKSPLFITYLVILIKWYLEFRVAGSGKFEGQAASGSVGPRSGFEEAARTQGTKSPTFP